MGTNFYLRKRITDDFKQVLTTNICKIINDVTVNNTTVIYPIFLFFSKDDVSNEI